ITWMMVFLRTLGVILHLPILAGRPIPVIVRLVLCVCLATLLAGLVPSATMPATFWALLSATVGEILVGLALGFVGRLCFAAVEMAGRIITTEIGITASPGMGVPEPSHEPLAGLLSSFAIVLFFMFGGHLTTLAALLRSFDFVLPGHPDISPAAGDSMIRATSHVIELGLRLSAPFIAMNFLVTLAFSALGRVVPKANAFQLSFSAKLFAGFSLLASAGALIARYLYTEFDETPIRMLQVLVGK
ncbi:MAG: flagellar biosynthetic protein FliR, partial [Opitutus sp.]